MGEFVLVAFAGFFAAMVDGALGMGFGPTSSCHSAETGISPAAVSATVNLAKVASGVAAGVSHWRLNNVDREARAGSGHPWRGRGPRRRPGPVERQRQ